MSQLGNSWWPERLLQRNPLTRVLVCGRQVEPPLYSHVVNFPRLEVPLSGCYESQIEVGGRVTTVSLTPGSALFAPPNCWNLPVWRQRVQLMSLLFGQKQMGVSLVSLKRPAGGEMTVRKFSMPRPLTGPLPRVLEAMVALHEAGEPQAAFPELARALLRCTQAAFRQPSPQPVNRARTLLEEVCIYLQNQYQYNVTRESVARQFGVSPNHLSRVFQQQGHMTFSNYLIHVRTDRAKHLLRSYDLKLDEVAARCGYRETAYFCRVFKKLAKMTPAEYRARQKAPAETPG